MDKTYTLAHHPDLDTMFDFLEGKLPEEDSDVLEKHLLECEACAAALEQMDRAGGPTPENRGRAADFQKIFLSGSPAIAPKKPGRGWNVFLRVAAIALLALNLGWAGLYFSGSLSQSRFSPLSADEVVRGNPDDKLNHALAAYQKGNYGEAVALLQAIPDSSPEVELKLLYLGNALMALNRYEEATVPLRKLCDNPDWTLYRDQARHYLGTAYLRLGKLPD
jgi:tetratricopeptide (TPR) repeat protein